MFSFFLKKYPTINGVTFSHSDFLQHISECINNEYYEHIYDLISAGYSLPQKYQSKLIQILISTLNTNFHSWNNPQKEYNKIFILSNIINFNKKSKKQFFKKIYISLKLKPLKQDSIFVNLIFEQLDWLASKKEITINFNQNPLFNLFFSQFNEEIAENPKKFKNINIFLSYIYFQQFPNNLVRVKFDKNITPNNMDSILYIFCNKKVAENSQVIEFLQNYFYKNKTIASIQFQLLQHRTNPENFSIEKLPEFIKIKINHIKNFEQLFNSYHLSPEEIKYISNLHNMINNSIHYQEEINSLNNEEDFLSLEKNLNDILLHLNNINTTHLNSQILKLNQNMNLENKKFIST